MEQIDATESYSRRNRILDIFCKKGPLNFNALKQEYELISGESFPYDGDQITIQQLFLEFGIQYDHKSKNYYVKREYNFRQKPKGIFHGTPYAKRSRSAPFKEDDEEDVEEIRKTVINVGSNKYTNIAGENRISRPTRRKDYKQQQQMNNLKPRSKSEYRSQLLGKPHICGTIIIADDFFLGITTKILSFKADKVDGVLQSGFCVSGLTIPAAKKMVDETITDDRYKTALIYLGSIDIIQNKYLLNIMQEFTEFVAVCARKKISPILCTLAPMPNLAFDDNRLATLKAFNEFLRDNNFSLPVIDIYTSLLNPNTDDYQEKYYQPSMPQKTSGCDKPIVLWSAEGTKRVHDFVLKNLGFALLSKETKVLKYL